MRRACTVPVAFALGLVTPLASAAAAADTLPVLYDQLAAAHDRADAQGLERRIGVLWRNAIEPTTATLVEGGHAALAANLPHKALDDFSSAIDLQPGIASLWRERGIARLDEGDTGGAIADLGQAIDLDQRDYLAWEMLSVVLERQGHATASLAAWQKVLLIDPHADDASKRLDTLERKAQGQRA